MKFITPAFLLLFLAACSGGDKAGTGTITAPNDTTGDADTHTDTDADTEPTGSDNGGGTGS